MRVRDGGSPIPPRSNQSWPRYARTTTNIEGSDTSGSNMLLSLRKDAGVPSGIMLGQQAAQSAGDSYQRVPVSSAPYVTLEDGTRAAS